MSFQKIFNVTTLTATRAQQRTCTSWQWWEGGATPMGCRGCLGLLMAEVSLNNSLLMAEVSLAFCLPVQLCMHVLTAPMAPNQFSKQNKYPPLMLILLQMGPESQIVLASI